MFDWVLNMPLKNSSRCKTSFFQFSLVSKHRSGGSKCTCFGRTYYYKLTWCVVSNNSIGYLKTVNNFFCFTMKMTMHSSFATNILHGYRWPNAISTHIRILLLLYTLFLYKQRFFSTYRSLIFSWIELQMLFRCYLIHIIIIHILWDVFYI